MTAKTLPYSAVGGQVTRRETFNQLIDYQRLAQDCCQRMASAYYLADDYTKFDYYITMSEEAANVIGHLFNTEDDERSKLLAHGWYGIGEMFHNNRITFRQLAMRPHTNQWAKVRKLLERVTWEITKMHEEKLQ